MNKPLENIRVVDFTRVLSGPYCTMLLSDMGAEVIKIERPQKGDDTRHFGPFKNEESGYFVYLNRGKKSITLDLKDESSVETLKKLVKTSDVIVENFRPGVMKKLGLDYETLKEVNPALVYASISGFGQEGPYSKRPAYDLVAQAMGGMMSVTGFPDTPPTRVGSSLGDMSSALYAAFGIMLALFHRERTGIGQYLDIAMMDSIFSMLENNVMRYTMGGETPDRIGSRHPISTPFDVFAAKDGYLVIAVANDPLFKRLCETMNRTDLIDHPKFYTDQLRTDHEKELKEIIEAWLANYSVNEAVHMINEGGAPCSPILDISQICEGDHIKERDMLIEMDQPGAGNVQVPGVPVKFSETPAIVNSPSPGLGQHNNEVLQDLLNDDPDRIQKQADNGSKSIK